MLESIIMSMAMSAGKKAASSIAAKVALNIGAAAGSMAITSAMDKNKNKKLQERVLNGEFGATSITDPEFDLDAYEAAVKKERIAACIQNATISGLALGGSAVAFNKIDSIIKK